MDYLNIIKAPIITEKTEKLKEENVVVFKVARDANKTQIKQAIEKTFNVKVEKITTLNTLGKKKRVGRYVGKTPAYKKAMVKLMEGSKIEF